MLSKTGLHTVRALVALAEFPQGGYVGAAAIAEKIGAPRNYLGKLLQVLSHQGLVLSQRGREGGFRLARAPQEISLFDVVEPIDHISQWTDCILGHKFCLGESQCTVHDRWRLVSESYLRLLKETSIADLAGRGGEW